MKDELGYKPLRMLGRMKSDVMDRIKHLMDRKVEVKVSNVVVRAPKARFIHIFFREYIAIYEMGERDNNSLHNNGLLEYRSQEI
jgi:hypothetical protein